MRGSVEAPPERTCAPNPASGVRVRSRPRIVEEEDEKARALTPRAADHADRQDDPKWRTLVLLLGSTGLRINEALALKWRDLDLGNKPGLRVRRAIKQPGKKGATPTLGPPKSQASRRRVPIGAEPAMALRLRRAETSQMEHSDFVFPSSTGGPMSHGNLRRRHFTPAAREAGVPWAGFHTLRHTFASLLFAEGRNIRQVQALLGHSDPAFTLRTYVHLLDGDTGGPLELSVQAESSVRVVEAITPGVDDATASEAA